MDRNGVLGGDEVLLKVSWIETTLLFRHFELDRCVDATARFFLRWQLFMANACDEVHKKSK